MSELFTTDWREDPYGNIYRIHCRVSPYGNYWVEYKPQKLQFSSVPFTHFQVKVRDEVWSVWARDVEHAALPFWADVSKTYPKRSEVEVTEVINGADRPYSRSA